MITATPQMALRDAGVGEPEGAKPLRSKSNSLHRARIMDEQSESVIDAGWAGRLGAPPAERRQA